MSLVHMADRLVKLETRAYGAKAAGLDPFELPPLPVRVSLAPSPDYALCDTLPAFPEPCGCEQADALQARLVDIKEKVDAHCRWWTLFAEPKAELIALYELLRQALP